MRRRQADEVSLVSGGISWSRLPVAIKTKLVASVTTVAKAREGLRKSVLVPTLPPVRIIPALWMNPQRTGPVDGRATVMRRGRHFVFGVELPAQVVLTGSEETIAAVLIHEFGHCFYFSTEVIDHIDAGRGPQLPPSRDTGNIYGDEAADRAHLLDPHKWFSPDVAQAFPYWNDPRIQICLDPLWVDHLPVEDGAHHFEANGISIPDDVVEHVRKLRPNRP